MTQKVNAILLFQLPRPPPPFPLHLGIARDLRILAPVHTSVVAVARSTTEHIIVLGIPLGHRRIREIAGRGIETREVPVNSPGIFPVLAFTALVDEKFDTAGKKERVIPKFNQVDSHDRALGRAAVLLGVFGNGKPTVPSIGEVLHEFDPIGVVDVVSVEDHRHPRDMVYQVVHILDLESIELGVGLRRIGGSTETFGKW